jgi:hypothetical protein
VLLTGKGRERRKKERKRSKNITLNCLCAPRHEDVYGREEQLHLFVELGRPLLLTQISGQPYVSPTSTLEIRGFGTV